MSVSSSELSFESLPQMRREKCEEREILRRLRETVGVKLTAIF